MLMCIITLAAARLTQVGSPNKGFVGVMALLGTREIVRLVNCRGVRKKTRPACRAGLPKQSQGAARTAAAGVVRWLDAIAVALLALTAAKFKPCENRLTSAGKGCTLLLRNQGTAPGIRITLEQHNTS